MTWAGNAQDNDRKKEGSINPKPRVNHEIKIKEVRAIGPEGEQLGIFPTIVAIKKALNIVDLRRKIMLIDMGAELDFLHLSGALVLFHGMNFFALLIHETTKIHHLADRRLSIW